MFQVFIKCSLFILIIFIGGCQTQPIYQKSPEERQAKIMADLVCQVGDCEQFKQKYDNAKDISEVSVEEKKRWAKAIAAANGCESPRITTQPRTEGMRESYRVQCTNMEMIVHCEFIGPIFAARSLSAPGGQEEIPFVKVIRMSGTSYDYLFNHQPACWQ